MKKIAVIAPCILPVPASRGGAVEELITCIINQNEISKQYVIDLYTIADCSYDLKKYSYTNIIPVLLDKFTSKKDRVCDKYYRSIKNKSAKRFFDKQIISTFIEESSKIDGSYFAIIIENQMSLVVELLNVIGKNRDYPIYYHMHNDVDIYRSPEYIKTLAKNGVQFIAISEYIKSQIQRYSKEAVVHMLYNGIQLDDYAMTTRKPDGMIRFLYAGRVIPTKGVKEAVEAFKIMHNDISDEYKNKVTFEIIGFSDNPTNYEKKVFRMAQDYPNQIKCQKRLSTTEMAKKYNDYDVVVMPTIDEEPFGLVALETIAKGMALITTNSGAIPEVVGEGAIIVNKNSDFTQALSVQMEKLVLDSEYRFQLGKKAYSEARRVVEFDINTYYHRLVDILDTECSQVKISIIVPVYNVERYLERCVKSLINQSYNDLELILVDDGSTDDSGRICDELAELDSRIKVVHQKNRGLSGARNSGLDVATGSYIFFVDSDDYLDTETCEKMLAQAIRCRADIIACGFSHVFDNQPEIPFTNSNYGMWSGREAVMEMMRNNNICTTAWNKLYKASLWEGIRFPEGRVHEDEATTYKLLYKSDLVFYMPECFYKYYQNDNSIMSSGVEARYGDYVIALRERIQFFKSVNELELADYSIQVLLEYIKYVYRRSADDKDSLKKQYNHLVREYKIPREIKTKKKIALYLWKFIKV